MPRRYESPEDNAMVERNIRRLRKLRAMNQTDLGDVVGVTFQEIGHYELGKHTLSLLKARVIADALGAPITALLEPNQAEDRRPYVRSRRARRRAAVSFDHMPMRVP
jgi:transcriptional regulator with XRE-family HTH domain